MKKNFLLCMISMLLLAVMPSKAQNTITPGDYTIKADITEAGEGVDFLFKQLTGMGKTLDCKIREDLNPEGPILCMTVDFNGFAVTINFTPYPIANDKVAYTSEQYINSPLAWMGINSKYSICGADGNTNGEVTLSKVDRVLDTWEVSSFGLMSNGVMKVLIQNGKLVKKQNAPNKEGVEVSISKAGVGTFCPIYGNVSIPEGVKVHIIQEGVVESGAKDGAEFYYVRTEEVDATSIIGYKEGVIVEGEPNSTVLFPYSEEPYTELNNSLIGATENVTADGSQYAFTAKLEGDVYLPVLRHVKEGATIPQGKAYYVPKSVAAAAEYLNIIFNDDDITAIENIKSDNATMNGVAYSISGQKVSADYKGIVIRNGKKMLVK